MKRYLSVLLSVLLVLGILTGCSGAKGTSSADRAPMEALSDQYYVNTESESKSDSLTTSTGLDSMVSQDRKLIRTVHLYAETDQYDQLLPGLNQKLTELGGYIQSRESRTTGRRNCAMVLRIPANKLDLFVEHVNANANVINSSETADDVTLEYVDTSAKITALETEQARLLELLAAAEDLESILKIEERLSDVTYELERYASRLRTLDNQVDYATIHLSIQEVTVYTPVEEPTVWYRISTGFAGTIEDLGDNITDAFVWIIVESPNILLFALMGTAAFAVLRKLNFKRRKKNTPPPAEPK